MNTLPIQRLRAVLGTGLLFASVQAFAAPAAYVSFYQTDGSVSSINFEPLSFELTTSYSDSQIQLRIFDLYPGGGSIDAGNVYSGFTVQKNSDTPVTTSASFATWTPTLGGNSTDGDLIVWVNIPFSFVNGDTFTISGLGASNGNLADQISAPSEGAFQVHLISANDGSSLGSPVYTGLEVGPAPIPEPSAYAAIFGGLALAGAVGARRRR